MGCFSNCCSWEVEIDSLGTEPHPVQASQSPEACTSFPGSWEGGPASGDYFGEGDGVQPGVVTDSPVQ